MFCEDAINNINDSVFIFIVKLFNQFYFLVKRCISNCILDGFIKK